MAAQNDSGLNEVVFVGMSYFAEVINNVIERGLTLQSIIDFGVKC